MANNSECFLPLVMCTSAIYTLIKCRQALRKAPSSNPFQNPTSKDKSSKLSTESCLFARPQSPAHLRNRTACPKRGDHVQHFVVYCRRKDGPNRRKHSGCPGNQRPRKAPKVSSLQSCLQHSSSQLLTASCPVTNGHPEDQKISWTSMGVQLTTRFPKMGPPSHHG